MRPVPSLAVCSVLAAVIALTACSSNGNPADPSDDGPNTIRITANNGSQSFSPNPAPLGGQGAQWRNNHSEIHHIVANDGSFDTGEIPPGGISGMVQIPAAGGNYHCTLHPTMVGAVGGSGGAAPPPCEGIYC
ncbi:MAG: hypothetical protein AB7F99_09925 [Vicinamibacterales bacterium]